MNENFFFQGQGFGGIAGTLLQHNFDTGAMRPWTPDDAGDGGPAFITLNADTDQARDVRVGNANATLRVREWIQLDTVVLTVARNRLQAWSDLAGANSVNIPNGMGHTVLQYQTQSDITDATVSMDGSRKSERDRPVYDLRSLPLPLVHKDFSFTARELAVSRNTGVPLDTSMAEMATRKVVERIEAMTLGTVSYAYGGGTLYGYTSFTDRITYSITLPTASGWTPAHTVSDVLAMKQLSIDNFFYGPWIAYFGTAWEQYLDEDYSPAKGAITLRQRIAAINGISAVRTLDNLSGNQILLVQMTSNVCRAVNFVPIQLLQWPDEGGMVLNFKVIAGMVPQLRSDYNNNTGIVHGS